MAWFRCGGGVNVDFVTAGAGQIVSGYVGANADGDPVNGTFEGQEKSSTPTTTAQNITPDTGKWLSKVTVGAIPNQTAGGTVTLNSSTTSASRGANKWLTSEFKVQVTLYTGG